MLPTKKDFIASKLGLQSANIDSHKQTASYIAISLGILIPDHAQYYVTTNTHMFMSIIQRRGCTQ